MASAALLVLAMLALSAASPPLVLACESCASGVVPASTPLTGSTPAITLPALPDIGLPIGIGSVTPVVGAAAPAVGAITPAVGAVTPAVGAITPAVGAVTPAIGAITPAIGSITPAVGAITPAIGSITPAVGAITPPVGAITPAVGAIAPAVGAVTPAVGAITPAIGAITPAVGAITPAIGSTPKYSSPKISHGGRKAKGCSPPPPSPPSPSSNTCPIDALKLGVCVDLLGNDVHVGDKSVQCCPLVKGVAGLSAAACLCTALKAKVLDLSVYVPIALKLLVNCGCAIPSGYTCA